MLVAPDGFWRFLDIQGSYFSNPRHNDANILIKQFRDDVGGMRNWLQRSDILIGDRGYRDMELI